MVQRSSLESLVCASSLASAPCEDAIGDSVIVVDAKGSALSPSVEASFVPSADSEGAISPVEPSDVSAVGFGAHWSSIACSLRSPSKPAWVRAKTDDVGFASRLLSSPALAALGPSPSPDFTSTCIAPTEYAADWWRDAASCSTFGWG